MRVKLAGLGKGPQTHRHTGPASQYLNDSETFLGDIKIKATVQRESGLLRLDLTAEIEGHFTCDRCGTPFDRSVAMQDEFFYSFETHYAAPQDAEMLVIPKGALEIDVSQEIRDLILLSLPLRMLCREDCRGLCPLCGANLNEEIDHQHEETADPRWEALQKMKKNHRSL